LVIETVDATAIVVTAIIVGLIGIVTAIVFAAAFVTVVIFSHGGSGESYYHGRHHGDQPKN
jgi:hypothetical protein